MKKTMAFLILTLAGFLPASAVTFATNRLQIIARCLHLSELDTLSAGTCDTYQYRNHALNIRVNSYGEVEHIGFRLFPNSIKKGASNPVYDFLERNLLERNLPNLGDSLRFYQAQEHVHFITGGAQDALKLDTMDIVGYNEERIDFHTYHVSWNRQGRTMLDMMFDMDYQLLSGCNAEELEYLFMKRLLRFKPHENLPQKYQFPKHTKTYVAAGDTFLIREMRNELFYEHDSTGWHLTDSTSAITKVLHNMMLSMEFRGNPTLTVSLDKYSDVKGVETLPYKHWLQMCLDEGCTPFFGVKDITNDTYKCTVLMTNPKGGYVHLLSVIIPYETVRNRGNGDVKGYLYVYIPMHNVSSNYFKL